MTPEDRIRELLEEIARTGRDVYGLAGMSPDEIGRRTMQNPSAQMPPDFADLSRAAAEAVNRSYRKSGGGFDMAMRRLAR